MSLENNTQIKNRMIKKAASLWGVPPNEIENSFDPIISLLIGACASEISKISGEINSSQTRITERLIQLMTPDTLYGARPAHAIAYAEPSSKDMLIAPENLFYFKKKVKTRNAGQEIKNIFFSPVQDYKLVDAKITHIVCDDEAYEVEGKTKSSSKLSLKGNTNLPPSTLYLGIKSENKEIDLKGVSLFFELLDVQDKDLFYHHLQNAELYFKDQPLDTNGGFINSRQGELIQLESIFSLKPNKTITIENEVNKTYQKHFVTINSNVSLDSENTLPSDFKKLLHLKDHEEFENLTWIKVVFSRIIDADILKNIFTSLNSFPVINRKLESISFQLKDYIDVIPISTMDLFLDIKSITNTSGKPYKLIENDSEQDQKGTFVIRRDNVGKLDSRKAKEYLLHLVELLKDESAAFSIFGSDFLQSNINELNQNIAALEKKLSDMNNATAETNYISVKPLRKKDTLLIDYWTTNGDEANQIKSGTSLQVYKGSEIKQKETFFLTSTYKGKNDLSMEERLYAYRRALLTRNRIVTKEDIKALCYEICGDKIEQITIKKGFRTAINLQKGLVPSIEIILHTNKKVRTSELEWNSIKKNILSVLEEQSLNVFPYHITIAK